VCLWSWLKFVTLQTACSNSTKFYNLGALAEKGKLIRFEGQRSRSMRPHIVKGIYGYVGHAFRHQAQRTFWVKAYWSAVCHKRPFSFCMLWSYDASQLAASVAVWFYCVVFLYCTKCCTVSCLLKLCLLTSGVRVHVFIAVNPCVQDAQHAFCLWKLSIKVSSCFRS